MFLIRSTEVVPFYTVEILREKPTHRHGRTVKYNRAITQKAITRGRKVWNSMDEPATSVRQLPRCTVNRDANRRRG